MAKNTKQIMILRHAKAEPDAPAGDYARSLTDAGRKHAKNLGRKLHTLKLIPQSIYSSSAKRTLETSDAVCEQLFIDNSQVAARDELYQADVHTFLSLLQQLDNRISRVMLVGHNPALEDLVDALSSDVFESDQPNGKRMLPATMVMLEFNGDWSQLSPHLCDISSRIHGKLC